MRDRWISGLQRRAAAKRRIRLKKASDRSIRSLFACRPRFCFYILHPKSCIPAPATGDVLLQHARFVRRIRGSFGRKRASPFSGAGTQRGSVAFFACRIAHGFCVAQAELDGIFHIAAAGITVVFCSVPAAGDPYALSLGIGLLCGRLRFRRRSLRGGFLLRRGCRLGFGRRRRRF